MAISCWLPQMVFQVQISISQKVEDYAVRYQKSAIVPFEAIPSTKQPKHRLAYEVKCLGLGSVTTAGSP
jgi:hypothetical protein